MSQSSFSANIAKFCERAKDKGDQVAQKLALDMFSAVILRSPVRSGRFRGNWFPAIGSPSTETTDAVDPTGAAAIARAEAAVAQFGMGKVIFLSNALPYALRLEYGYSQQAASGMVRPTITEYEQYIADAVASVK